MASISDSFAKLSITDTSVRDKRTGLVFDDRMIEHSCLWDPNHIEQPKRYICPLQRCRDYGLIERCVSIPSKFAEESEILMLHSKEYFEVVKKSTDYTDVNELEKLSSNFDSVYFHPKTYDAALLAAGCTLQLVREILENEVQNGMAIVRPPGHHAMTSEACGFCFFNNVALATKLALSQYKLKKIMIVDWDVHHGQATQQMFYSDPRVLYVSIHRYEHGAFWPELRESNFDFAGDEDGIGYNINIPLNETKASNGDYLAIFNNVILPIAYEFSPDLVIVSAGYDAALGCPEGEMEVTPQAYAHLTHLLSGLANGRICVILEGGYCLPSLSESVALTLRTLLGDPCPSIQPTDGIKESVIESILNVICIHRNFWESLTLQDVYDSKDDEPSGQKKKHFYEIKYVGTLPLSKPSSYPTKDYYPVQDKSVSLNLENRLEKLIGVTDLTVPKSTTCIAFDMGMTEHVNQREKWHPEKPERVTAIFEKFKILDLLQKCDILLPRRATEKELGLVHVPDYIEEIKSTRLMKKRDIAKLQAEYQSVYMCQGTYESATLACGSLLQAVDAVCKQECQNCFAIIRPPGHHAGVDEACGFCIFNSVAIAAKYAMEEHSVQKVLILDWDVHHGNGTQNIFYSDDKVLYISLHRYDCGTFFPCSHEANYDAVGEGAGMGYNVNIPWNGPMEDGDFLASFFHIVLPIAYEFCPDLVLVSAGFDAAKDDPLGGCKVTPTCFGHLTHLLKGLANGRIILALEGGYNINSTSEAAFLCVSSLIGEPCDYMKLPKVPSNSAIETIKNVIENQKKYWKCLQFSACLPSMKTPTPPKDQPESTQTSNAKQSSPVSIPRRDSDAESKPFERRESASVSDMCVTLGGATGGSENDFQMLYCVSPLEYCPHLELIQSLPAEGLDPNAPCQDCGDPSENWVCLHCYQVYCGRFINEHMLCHGVNMQHYLTLSYSDLSVWCYACDSYVHNPALMPAKQHVHQRKFGLPM